MANHTMFNNEMKNSSRMMKKKTNVTSSIPGSIRPVYGAQHPPIQDSGPTTPTKRDDTRKRPPRDSFQDFENDTNDAWDDGDDDLILKMAHANVKMSMKDVRSTAMAVINSHSQLQQKQIKHETFSRQNSNGAKSNNGSDSPQPQNPGPRRSTSPFGPGVGVRLNNSKHVPRSSQIRGIEKPKAPDREQQRIDKFKMIINQPKTDISDLRKLSWSGIPPSIRPIVWKLLSGYVPPINDRRVPTLERKRSEYWGFVGQYFDSRLDDINESTYRQIQKDLCRMTVLTSRKEAEEIFERILFIWAIRHPASGYVQGMNDLVTPFFVVYLSEFSEFDLESEDCDIHRLPQEQLNIIEADSYWSLSKLLDGIQDNYTFAQPGIQTKVNALKELITRIDVPLHQHLENQQVEYLQFSFRWMNNLLMREIPLRCIIRLWDTYQAEPEGFATLHLYVCAAFLVRFSSELLREKDFQGLMLMLQNLPTYHWGDEEIGLLLAEAFKLKYMFADAPNHLHSR